MSAWSDLHRQLRDNRRLRIGVAAIAVILWAYALLVGGDALQRKSAELQSELRRLGHAERLLNEGDWPERGQHAIALRTELEQRVGRLPTAGLARADFEESLRRAANSAKVARFTLQMAAAGETVDAEDAPAATDTVPNLLVLRARTSFDFSPPETWRLLQALTTEGKLTRVESLRIRRDPARVELDVAGYYQLAEDPQ